MKYKLFVFGMLFAAAAIPAVADVVYNIPAEAPPYLINGAATGINVLEAFIEGSPAGVSFASSGFTNLNSGWTAMGSGYFAQEIGPASNYLNEDLVLSALVTSLPVHLYGFSGCTVQLGTPCGADTLTDGYAITFADGVYPGYSPLATRNFAAEVQPSVPEPASMGEAVAVGLFLIGAGATFQKRKLQQQRR